MMNNTYESDRLRGEFTLKAAWDMYDALWAAVELSDRTLPKSGRTAECQKVYDQCVAALKLAEGE